MRERSLPAGPGCRARVRCSDRHDGDFQVDAEPEGLAARRRALAPGPWTWLRQVHGATVIEVDRPGAGAGAEADAAVTSVPGAVLAVQTADCAPLVLVGTGVVGVAHVGWRGLVAGIVDATAAAVRARGSEGVRGFLGPCIGPGAYAFGADDLDRIVATVGPEAAGRTDDGGPALDLPAAVAAACRAAGVTDLATAGDDGVPADTAGADWFSHRTRGDRGRQVTVAWLEDAP